MRIHTYTEQKTRTRQVRVPSLVAIVSSPGEASLDSVNKSIIAARPITPEIVSVLANTKHYPAFSFFSLLLYHFIHGTTTVNGNIMQNTVKDVMQVMAISNRDTT